MAELTGKAYLKPEELSERLDVPIRTLENWRRHKIGPPWAKFGNAVRYPIAGVERHEREQLRQATA